MARKTKPVQQKQQPGTRITVALALNLLVVGLIFCGLGVRARQVLEGDPRVTGGIAQANRALDGLTGSRRPAPLPHHSRAPRRTRHRRAEDDTVPVSRIHP